MHILLNFVVVITALLLSTPHFGNGIAVSMRGTFSGQQRAGRFSLASRPHGQIPWTHSPGSESPEPDMEGVKSTKWAAGFSKPVLPKSSKFAYGFRGTKLR